MVLRIFILLMFLTNNNSFAANKIMKSLIYRIEYGNISDIKSLINEGKKDNSLDINLLDDIGWPIISLAANRHFGAKKAVKLLLDAGANINNGGKYRQYPLRIAVQTGNKELVNFLLNRDADYKIKNEENEDLQTIAENYGYKDIAQIFFEIKRKNAATYMARFTEKYRKEQIYNLKYFQCAHSYYNYYYKTKMSIITKKVKTLAKYNKKAGFAYTELLDIFKYDRNDLIELRQDIADEITLELDKLISNRFRRKKGVGKLTDMESRCTRITKYYKFNREYTPAQKP